ncbi:MAG: GldG family protein [Elusimicrobiales bacterium]|nr:GldG family protein [Elusimicrobiales bacterium]
MKKENVTKILTIFLSIVIINAMFYYTAIRLDMTKSKIYSLSQGTKEILKKVKDNLFIDLYYSQELPSQITTNKDYAISLLKDYSFYSKGKIKFSGIKIKNDDSQKKKQAIEEGITPVRFDIISKEKFEQTEGFLGIAIRYYDKKEVIPFISDISNLEYDISSRINSMIKETKNKIYFITDAGGLSNYRINSELRNQLSSNYEIEDATLETLYNSTEPIIASYIGPTSILDEKSLFYLDQILVKGSKVFIAYDKKYTSMENFFTRDNTTGIEKIFEANGIKINNTLIMDESSQAIQIGFRQGFFLVTNIVKYPFFILTQNLNTNHPTTREVYSLTIPFASPIEVSTNTNLNITKVVFSSKRSWAKKENSYISIYPFQKYEINNDDIKGPFVVAISAKGKFQSSFDKEIEIEKNKKKEKIKPIKKSDNETILYLVTSSKFIHQENLNIENIQYFINILNYISQDEALLSIRTKKAGFIPLKEIKESYKLIIKYLNIFLPVILLLCFGIYKWNIYKKRVQKAIEAYK